MTYIVNEDGVKIETFGIYNQNGVYAHCVDMGLSEYRSKFGELDIMLPRYEELRQEISFAERSGDLFHKIYPEFLEESKREMQDLAAKINQKGFAICHT